MLDIEHIFELHEQGLSTGKIALAIGLTRTPASRQRIRTILRSQPPSKPKHLEKHAADNFVKISKRHQHVRRSTGHKFHNKRKDEAEFILGQFARYECKFKDKVQEWIDGIDLNLITPDELFQLRDMYARKRKIFG